MRAIFLIAMLLCMSIQHVQAKDSALPPHIKTNYPFTHFCLNCLGLINIVKGSSIETPLIRSCIHIEPQINRERILLGLSLLLASRILHHYEVYINTLPQKTDKTRIYFFKELGASYATA